jgi:hypothetical protein
LSRQHIILAVKAILVIAFGALIYSQWSKYNNLATHQDAIKLSSIQWRYVIGALILVPVNWWLESIKWRILCQPFATINLSQSIKAILGGLTLGLLTPSRIGEYGGRALLTPCEEESMTVGATFFGSVAQNLWNIGLGMLMAYPMIQYLIDDASSSTWIYIILIIQLCVLVLIYFKLKWFISFFTRRLSPVIKQKLPKGISRFDYSIDQKTRVLGLALARYVLYFAQYSLLIASVNDAFDGLVLSRIASIYLIQSVVPIPAFLGLMMRGELAITVWQTYNLSPIWALTVTFGLWFFNLVIPAIFGLYFLIKADYRVNWFSRNQEQ